MSDSTSKRRIRSERRAVHSFEARLAYGTDSDIVSTMFQESVSFALQQDFSHLSNVHNRHNASILRR